MNELLIYYSVEKNIALALTWLAFILPFYSGLPDSYVCVLIVTLCVFMALRAIARILDRRVQVILDKDGISIRYLSELTIPWKEIAKTSISLDTRVVRPACFVTLHPRQPDRLLGDISFGQLIAQKIMAVFAGTEPILLNTSILTIGPDELDSAIKSAMRSQFHG